MLDRVLPGAAHLQNYHPLVVHFPIAFLFGAALLYFAAAIRPGERLEWAAFVMLLLGALAISAAVATGLRAGPSVMVAESVRAALLTQHEHLMIAAAILTGGLTLWALAARPAPTRGRVIFVLALVLLVMIITAGGDLGGRMAYEYNAGGTACAQPIELRK